MNPTIYLSCLVVVVGSLVWTVSARPGFEADKERVINIYGKDSPVSLQNDNVPLLVNFLDKYGDLIELTPDLRQRADNAVRQYKEERDNQPLVEGVPAQGGWLSIFKKAFVLLGMEIASAVVKKATAED